MALTRQERLLLHKKAQTALTGEGAPSKLDGKDGDVAYRRLSGIGIVHYVKREGEWQALSSTDKMPAERATIRVAGGTGASITDHGGLSGHLDDDHEQYLLVDGTRAMTSTMIIGSDADADRSITWGHVALKTIMGIDDSADAFVINTDDAFDATLANNSFSIDASHNVIIAGDVTVGDDLLFSSSGAVINWNSGDLTLTHSANTLTLAGGTLAAAAITGTTIDASTDFTIGSLVITDDSIVMTPSTSDTVTIAGATNGVLNITTVDAGGTTGDINLTADGQIEYRANDAAGHIFDINGTNQATITDGLIAPVTNNDIDLGSDALEFKDIWIDGTANLDTVDIDAGAIDGTTIGASSQAAGDFTAIGLVSAGTIAGTTIDASTDFTIDGLVLTADDITNDASLEIQTSTGTLTINGKTGINIQEDGGNVIVISNAKNVTFSAGDVLFNHTGGSTSDPDVEIDGYFVVDGTAEFNGTLQADSTVDINGSVDADVTTFDVLASGAISLDSGAASNLTTSSGALTLDGASGVSIAGNSSEVDITTTGTVDINSAALDIDASDAITIDSTSTILISGDGGATFSDDIEAIVYDGSGNLDFDAVALDMDLTDSSSITITSSEAAEDLTIAQVGGNDSSIIITAAGTGADAIKIDTTAGSMIVAPSLVDNKTLTVGNTNSTYMLLSPDDTASDEKVLIKNAAGTADAAIKLWSAAGGITLLAANDSLHIDADGTDSDALNIDSAGGVDVDAAGAIALDAGAASNLTTSAGALTITSAAAATWKTTAGVLTINGTAGINLQEDGSTVFQIDTSRNISTSNSPQIDLDSTGVISINSSGDVINIGNDAVAQNINIGTGAAARIITVGNVTGATALALNAGTGGIALASTGAGDITVNSDDTLLLDADGVLELNSSAGAISIGDDGVAAKITVGGETSTRTEVELNAIRVDINAGSNGVQIDGAGASNLTTSSGALTITSAAAATWSTAVGVLTIDGDDGITLQTTGSGNVTVSEILDITDTTDSSNATGDTGALRVEGGASIAKKLYVGTDLDVDGTSNLDNTDIDGDVDISGDLTMSAGGDGALQFSVASSIKILDNSASSLVIEEANNAYMTFTTTNSGEKVTCNKNLYVENIRDIATMYGVSGSDFQLKVDEDIDIVVRQDGGGDYADHPITFKDYDENFLQFFYNTNLAIIKTATGSDNLEINSQAGDISFKKAANATGLIFDLDTAGACYIENGAGNAVVAIDDGDRNLYFFDKGGEYIVSDGTDITVASGADVILDATADIVLDAAGGNFEFKDAGTTQLTIDADTTAGDIDINLNVNGDDLVFNQYDGTEVMRIKDTALVVIRACYVDDFAINIKPEASGRHYASGTADYQENYSMHGIHNLQSGSFDSNFNTTSGSWS